jgi:hypothetical protein
MSIKNKIRLLILGITALILIFAAIYLLYCKNVSKSKIRNNANRNSAENDKETSISDKETSISDKEVSINDEEKEKIFNEKKEKIKLEIGKLSEDSKNSIKNKLNDLYNKFYKARGHLDEIQNKEGEYSYKCDLSLQNINNFISFFQNEENLIVHEDKIDGCLLYGQIIDCKETLE